MKRAALLLLGLLVLHPPARAQEDSEDLHNMIAPDGQVQAEKCAACHNDDLTLSRSKPETCTLCHSPTAHAGAAEHARASAASVARLLTPTAQEQAPLPLTEDERIYCGTCHVFHDPAISNEDTQASPWLPRPAGLPESVKQAVEKRWQRAQSRHNAPDVGATFAKKGTRRLRLPVDDGSLCRRCHGAGR
ncbi:MAG: cytochrome c3 family protein [Deltaproteobacteria bacterium]|nr:cytochrome c3 family protein [Deltaproteobacteria bacterium]